MNLLRRQCLNTFCNAINKQNNNIIGRFVSFKSAFSLDKIYPTSNLRLYTPTFVPEDPNQRFSGYIPMDKIKITYSRSSGPGGQHVNKVNTKVDVRFHLKEATWLDEGIKEKLAELCKNSINKEGFLVIKSELTSSQQLNVVDALSKLRNLIRKTLVEPKETPVETVEFHRKRQIAASQRRLYEKRKSSQDRENRQWTD
ncbi:peptidyl-tRNA hydrolase ICT1, mitochondrial [Leptopilina heterotoma]|uniref:peptidyl-tRNA hydrolase ICT1, mitochondrial n=1 Tax=Leptopilina heterotoma TaxID=63436 RepID=UPI001CA9655C|nr:peptidyl-tRNA hydrolase ICT1, mitochondrial [Leptopilina heterotoma]